VPKCKILRNAAKPGVIVHIYVSYEFYISKANYSVLPFFFLKDFSSSLTDLLNDIAQLLENFRPGAKAKNLGIVCKVRSKIEISLIAGTASPPPPKVNLYLPL
jgi:hypothetical protein